MSAAPKYNRAGTFNQLEDKKSVSANNPTAHLNLKNIAKSLHSHHEDAVRIVAEIMKDVNNKVGDRLAAAKFIIAQTATTINILDRQKTMMKQIAMMDKKIQEMDIKETKLSEEDDSGDDIDNGAVFSSELHLIK